MKNLVTLTRRFLADEKAAEVTELGIVLALVVAGAIVTIKSIGTKVGTAYTTTNTNLP